MRGVCFAFVGCVWLACGGGELAPVQVAADARFCAYPVIESAALLDIHESRFNGPEGFAYFAEAGDAKTGVLPSRIGDATRLEEFDTCAHASNFQGPVAVGSNPVQWEWTADGEVQDSLRHYPAVFGHRCVTELADFEPARMRIKEHDEYGTPDDKVGAFSFDSSLCSSVLAAQESGWVAALRADGEKYSGDSGPADLISVHYSLWCYQCPGPNDCEFGIERELHRMCD